MIPDFVKRHILWLGFTAAAVPLMILLGLQFVWLAHLRRVSVIAHQAALSNFLESVGTEIQYYYRSNAERTLNLPASLFTQWQLDQVAYYWKKKPLEGAKRLFLVDFTRDQFGHFLVYDHDLNTLTTPPASDESLAIILASTPWQLVRFREAGPDSSSLIVEERDPEYRIVLNPMFDEDGKVVGMAGMLLDDTFFREKLLPAVIAKTVPSFFPDAQPGDLAITVRNPRGGVAFAFGDPEGKGHEVSAPIPFVFTDWTIALHTARNMPEHWASASFVAHLMLSGLLALVLIGGIAFALIAANRVMRLSEMKSDFASNVSHELRTPLASIRVFAELLRLGRVRSPEKVQEYGEYIDAESRRLTGLINNILDFARIESGRKTYEFAPADVGEVLAAVLKGFEVRLAPQGFRIAFDGPAEPLPPLVIDAEAIGQAFHNLLDNAVKYSGDSRELTVRLRRDGDSAAISVQDRGIGIPREEQRKIFERFHRVGTGLVHDVKGSGLGLSIVNHIVQAHGGRVAVESEPGTGSTFTIHLPLARGTGAEAEGTEGTTRPRERPEAIGRRA